MCTSFGKGNGINMAFTANIRIGSPLKNEGPNSAVIVGITPLKAVDFHLLMSGLYSSQ